MQGRDDSLPIGGIVTEILMSFLNYLINWPHRMLRVILEVGHMHGLMIMHAFMHTSKHIAIYIQALSCTRPVYYYTNRTFLSIRESGRSREAIPLVLKNFPFSG